MKSFSRSKANDHAMRSIYSHICRRLGKPIDKEATPQNDGVLCYKWIYTEDKSSLLSYLIENFIHLNNRHFISFNPYNVNHFDDNEIIIPELGRIIIFENDPDNNYILLKHKWNREFYRRYGDVTNVEMPVLWQHQGVSSKNILYRTLTGLYLIGSNYHLIREDKKSL